MASAPRNNPGNNDNDRSSQHEDRSSEISELTAAVVRQLNVLRNECDAEGQALFNNAVCASCSDMLRGCPSSQQDFDDSNQNEFGGEDAAEMELGQHIVEGFGHNNIIQDEPVQIETEHVIPAEISGNRHGPAQENGQPIEAENRVDMGNQSQHQDEPVQIEAVIPAEINACGNGLAQENGQPVEAENRVDMGNQSQHHFRSSSEQEIASNIELAGSFFSVTEHAEPSESVSNDETVLLREMHNVMHLYGITPPRGPSRQYLPISMLASVDNSTEAQPRSCVPYTQAFQNATPQDGEESMELPSTSHNVTPQDTEGSMGMQSTLASASHEVEQQQPRTCQNTTPQDSEVDTEQESTSLLSDSDDSSDEDGSSEVDELTESILDELNALYNVHFGASGNEQLLDTFRNVIYAHCLQMLRDAAQENENERQSGNRRKWK